MKIKAKICRILTVTLMILAVCGFPVRAEEMTAEPDLTQKNSISVTLKNSSGNRIIPSGEFTMYLVAEIKKENGILKYRYTNGFENCGIELGNLDDGDLPKKLQEKISKDAWKSVQKVGTEGTATFCELNAGLYLIVNSRAAKGYYAVNPFLVSAPMKSDGTWVYTVDASPKMETAKPTEPDNDEPDNDEPDEPEKPTKPNKPETPTAPTTPEVPTTTTAPEHEDHSDESTPDYPDRPDEPDDLIRRYGTPDGPGGKFVLDERARKKLLAEQQGGTVSAATLPKTGQLNWPVPVLAVSGMLVFSVGWVLKRGNRRDEK